MSMGIDGLDRFPEPFPLIIFCFLELFIKPTCYLTFSIYFRMGGCENYQDIESLCLLHKTKRNSSLCFDTDMNYISLIC